MSVRNGLWKMNIDPLTLCFLGPIHTSHFENMSSHFCSLLLLVSAATLGVLRG